MNNWDELEKNIRDTVEQHISYDPNLRSGVEASLAQKESKSITWLVVPTLLIALVTLISLVRSDSSQLPSPHADDLTHEVNPSENANNIADQNSVKPNFSETSEKSAIETAIKARAREFIFRLKFILNRNRIKMRKIKK